MKCAHNWLAKLSKKPLKFTLFLFILALLFVGLHGEFPVNDDWIFFRQLEGFRVLGNFNINAVIDPSFITQGLMGHVWVGLVGLSFEKLRILTVIITVGLLFVMNKLLKKLEISDSITLAVLLLTAFNPIIFTTTFSFMTENYYLFFYFLSLLNLIKYFDKEKISYLVLGLVFAGCAMLLRQLGLVLFIAFFLTALYYKKLTLKNILALVIIGGLFFYTFAMWPRYLDGNLSNSYAGLVSNLAEGSNNIERLTMMLWVLPYFAFFMLPLAFYSPKAEFKKHKIAVRVLAVVGFYFLATWLFNKDIFPVGSVLYVEGLHMKSNFRSHFSIFNNVLFKSLLATLIGLATTRIVLFYNKVKKLDITSTFLLLTALGSFAILLFGNDYYERYTLPAFFSSLLFFVYYFKSYVEFGTKFQWAVLSLFIAFSVLQTYDYMAHTRLRWDQALKIQDETGYINSIFVDGTYAKHFAVIVNEDYKGFDAAPSPGDKKCYVQKYYVEQDNAYLRFWNKVEDISEKKIGNPELYGAKRNRAVPNIKKHLDELMFNEEYFSPAYNLVGKKAYVGSWCAAK